MCRPKELGITNDLSPGHIILKGACISSLRVYTRVGNKLVSYECLHRYGCNGLRLVLAIGPAKHSK